MKKVIALLFILFACTTIKATDELVAHVDYVNKYVSNGKTYFYLAGWLTGNNVRPSKTLQIDGNDFGYSDDSFITTFRPEECNKVRALGWSCDDGLPHQCGMYWINNPTGSCIGVVTLIDPTKLSSGTHKVNLCARYSNNVVCDLDNKTIIIP